MKNETFTLHQGDCIETLRGMADDSVDAVVTDPPYGLSQHSTADIVACLTAWLAGEKYRHGKAGFMGRSWDAFVPGPEVWREVFRVLKPGGHVLAFAGTRTQDLMCMSLRLAGFEVRDMIGWLYGSGFPKSMDVSKAIDEAAGAEREIVGVRSSFRPSANASRDPEGFQDRSDGAITTPSTEAAKQWEGWGTALKPALEPITVARKPLIGTVAENVLTHGTGALNIDGCRVGWPDGKAPDIGTPGWCGRTKKLTAVPGQEGETVERTAPNNAGRFPANIIHDGSPEVLAVFPDSNGSGGSIPQTKVTGYGDGIGTGKSEYKGGERTKVDAGSGSAARFFYCAKASRKDRNEGVGGSNDPAVGTGATMREREDADWPARNGNFHPTVKPTDLMAYLCRLITPPGGVVLDPFMGSGSTGKAAMREGFRFIGCELSTEYIAIARARIEHELSLKQVVAPANDNTNQMDLFSDLAITQI